MKTRTSFLLAVLLVSLLTPSSLATTTDSGYDAVTYDTSITFTATLNNDGTVMTNWSKYNHAEDFTYYKLIRSQTNNNPVYPEDGYIYFGGDLNNLSYLDEDVPSGTSYYRICQIASPKRYCSTPVVNITKGAVSNQNMNTGSGSLYLSGQVWQNTSIKLTWTLNGRAPEGYKVVWSKNAHPTYPSRDGDYYHYLDSESIKYDKLTDLSPATYYVRVCIYGNGVCGTYSNELEFTVISDMVYPNTNSGDITFYDTGSHWGKDYIQILAEKCNITGYTDASGKPLYEFRPDLPITRAELVKVLVQCAYGSGVSPTEDPFWDVPTDAWYAPFVYKAKKLGWIGGYGDGSFKPGNYVTRVEAVKMILLAKFLESAITGGTISFTDIDWDAWYYKYVAYAVSKGYMSGYKDKYGYPTGKFGPANYLTRAEAAKMIVKIFGWSTETSTNSNTNSYQNSNTNTSTTNTNTNTGVGNTNSTGTGVTPMLGGCQVFPANNAWNTDISSYPVHSNSANYIASIGSSTTLHADFGGNGEYGIPYVVVGADQPNVAINFTAYGDESDAGPYPIPGNASIEGGSSSDGDRHVLVVKSGECKLYELYRAFPGTNGSWDADSGAVFDLSSNALRPDYWTSADAAGLAILPGLARYDEVAAGQMNHALRFTVSRSQKAFIHPATHYASSSTDANLPPMGLRVRLKAGYDISGFTGQTKVILATMKKYGMIVADNGSNWFVTGASDTRWSDDDLNQLKTVPGSAFEAVETGALIK